MYVYVMVAGGILPTTIHNNKIYFLFGKERNIDKTPGWSDFAGGQDNNENQFKTAIREGTEELTGFLGSETDLEKMLKKYGTFNIDFDTYRTHIFPIKYNEYLPFYYNNNQRFLQKHLDPKIIRDTKIFEKVEIKWVNFKELISMKKEFRSFYQNNIDVILSHKPQIEKFIRSAFKNYGTKKSIRRKNKTKKNKK